MIEEREYAFGLTKADHRDAVFAGRVILMPFWSRVLLNVFSVAGIIGFTVVPFLLASLVAMKLGAAPRDIKHFVLAAMFFGAVTGIMLPSLIHESISRGMAAFSDAAGKFQWILNPEGLEIRTRSTRLSSTWSGVHAVRLGKRVIVVAIATEIYSLPIHAVGTREEARKLIAEMSEMISSATKQDHTRVEA